MILTNFIIIISIKLYLNFRELRSTFHSAMKILIINFIQYKIIKIESGFNSYM